MTYSKEKLCPYCDKPCGEYNAHQTCVDNKTRHRKGVRLLWEWNEEKYKQ